MIALPIAAKLAGGFVARNWQLIAGALLAAALGLLLYGLKARSDRFERTLLTERAAWAEERAKAAAITAAHERRYRQLERSSQEVIDAIRTDAAAERAALQAEWGARLDGSRRGLLDHIARLAAYTAGPAADPGAAERDLRERAEALRLLVEQADGLADECVRNAEAIGTDLRAARRYADEVKAFRRGLVAGP